jgi:hypothetical protein
MTNIPISFSKSHFEKNIISKVRGNPNKKLLRRAYQLDVGEELYKLIDGLDIETNEEVEHQLIKAGLLRLESLEKVATTVRKILDKKRYMLLFAYNGTGKTRLSMSFKDQFTGDNKDTLYFNAFTEDLFRWDNNSDNNGKMVLNFTKESRFFDALKKNDLDIENRIRPLLHRYANFNFLINYTHGEVKFIREVDVDGTVENVENIKISRGEENLFIWCFFIAIVQLVLDKDESSPYANIKYIYIDDPISSLDENNAIAVAHHLSNIFKNHHETNDDSDIRTIVSSHHTLFFNVMCNEWGNSEKFYFSAVDDAYNLKELQGDTARIYHVAMLKELQKTVESNQICTYHFNILRSLMEKAAIFHGFSDFGHFIKFEDDDEEHTKLKRILQIMNHSGYSMMEPTELGAENKGYFIKIFNDFIATYPFNKTIFSEDNKEALSV